MISYFFSFLYRTVPEGFNPDIHPSFILVIASICAVSGILLLLMGILIKQTYNRYLFYSYLFLRLLPILLIMILLIDFVEAGGYIVTVH